MILHRFGYFSSVTLVTAHVTSAELGDYANDRCQMQISGNALRAQDPDPGTPSDQLGDRIARLVMGVFRQLFCIVI
ncbi:hypothetical protein GGR51DRAFT_562676 [Nemania sp. FL0031]|nr:hypothetical protein GGR51DRAFT_562676 [Nemania sp. FL0031]